MRLAVAKIFHRAITPSYSIIDLDDDTWMKFLHGDNLTRKDIVLKVTNTIESPSIREIAWLPLEGQNIVTEVPKV